MRSFSNRFFQLPTVELAQALLGAKLSTLIRGRLTSGIIVEVEAYHGDSDEASHAYHGATKRNEVMFGPPGHCYVYFIYGVHYCVNVVSEAPGTGAAVLIRALEPLEGLETMRARRGTTEVSRLTSGPGKLCQALGITPALLGENFRTSKRIRLEPRRRPVHIARSVRIGISKAQHPKWRFYERDSTFVSKGAQLSSSFSE